MTPTEIKAAYKSNPKFVVDLLHMHYFKTLTYFEERIEDDLNLRISKNLYLLFKSLQHPLSFAENSGEYSFTYKTNFMGMASYVPFPLLYNSLVKCSTSENIPEMLNKMYNSNDPILVQIAEDLKRERIELSSSLFDFLKQKECQMADGNLETAFTSTDCRKVASVKDLANGVSLGSTSICEDIDCSVQFLTGNPMSIEIIRLHHR